MEPQQFEDRPPFDAQADKASSTELSTKAFVPQLAEQPCPTCGSGKLDANDSVPANFVYSLGLIQGQFRSLAWEKEYVQAVGRSDTSGLTDRQTLQTVLSQPQNRYLARGLCWVFSVEGLPTYLVVPTDDDGLDMLIQTLRPNPRAGDMDVVIGMRGPIAPPGMCNGLQLPIVVPIQMYSFDADTLIKAIPRPEAISEDAFGPAAEELFTRIIQMADSAGTPDQHRALVYLAVRYPAIYALAAELFARNFALASVDTRPSRLSGARRILDVIFTFRNRSTDVPEMYFVRVDITEEFPFLVTKMLSYFER